MWSLDMQARLALEQSRSIRMKCLIASLRSCKFRRANHRSRSEIQTAVHDFQALTLSATAAIAEGPRPFRWNEQRHSGESARVSPRGERAGLFRCPQEELSAMAARLSDAAEEHRSCTALIPASLAL